jgi:alanyl-tRNA synthetase
MVEGRPAVSLSRTAFYPTGGGQPHDMGSINGALVIDVIKEAGEIWHVLESEPEGDEVQAELDWARRFDHMQHHTGQHVLTRAFIQTLGAETIGFHLGADSVTIDLNRENITPEQVARAEAAANAIVTDNVEVRAWFPSPKALEELPLRKEIEVEGSVRVVQVGDFDVTACGGTHVARTGEIGLIKVVKVERRGSESRVEFLCGGRALADYGQKHAILTAIANDFSVGFWEAGEAVERLRDENGALRSEIKALRQDALEREADALLAAADSTAGIRVIAHFWEEGGEIRKVASRLVNENAGVIALLGAQGEDGKSQVVFARSDDVDQDMGAMLRGVFETLGSGRGGGPPNFAQGGGVRAEAETVAAVLQRTKEHIEGGA